METVETLKNLLAAWGAGWVLWLLFALSIGSVVVVIERWLFFRRKSADVEALAAELDCHLGDGDVEGALDAIRPMNSVGASVVRAGLKLADRGPEAVDRAMESAKAIERKDLQDRLAYLGTLGNNAPFIGLFGTVIGVILAFEELGKQAGSAGMASAGVMGAVSEALVATAVGIGVALPAVAAHNYFQRRIAVLLDDADTLSNLVLAYMVEDEDGTETARVSSDETAVTAEEAPISADEVA
ncbi:MAG: MotA/TolQ/ExbB proton channel family protein [Bradymonadaceae bacterium]